MPRSIWNGVISFGMVSIPVKMYSATESKDVSFHLLHEKCNTRIKEYRWCQHCDRRVDWDEVERGYEYAKGRYVKLTAEDFEKLPLPSKHTIEVSAFVKSEEIDPVYYEKSYYLEPDEAAKKPFVLFMRTLTEKALVAIAAVAIRSKERLCALRPMGGTLILDTLLYPDEIRVNAEKKLPESKISPAELKMAFNLVDLMEKPFDPTEYKDHYREAVKEVIEAKLEGQEMVEAPEVAPTGKVIDLMEALKASVEGAKGGKSAKYARATKKTTRDGKEERASRKRKKVAK